MVTLWVPAELKLSVPLMTPRAGVDGHTAGQAGGL